MTVTIRDFTEADLGWAVDLLVDWDPAVPADAYRRVLTGEAARMTRCRVAEAGDERRGLAAIVEFEGMWRPMVSVVVEKPSERRCGLSVDVGHLAARDR